MVRVRIREKASQQITARNYSFTVVFESVGSGRALSGNGSRRGRGNKLEASGYQVTVPLLPGLITYGRTMTEAREMARDAIRGHLEGLKLKHPGKPQLRVTVPRHDRFDLPVPVLRSIIRQADMTVEEFLEFL